MNKRNESVLEVEKPLQRLASLLPDLAAREVRHDREGSYAADNVEQLRAAGILAINVPQSAGGDGAELRETLDVLRSLASVAPSTALMLAMHTSILANYLIDPDRIPSEHRAFFLSQRAWAWGEAVKGKVFAVANSEPGAHGDVHNSRATVGSRRGSSSPACEMESPEEDQVVNGVKSFASFGTNADYYMSAARDAMGHVDYLVVRNEPGSVSAKSGWDAIGMRSSESVMLELCEAPAIGPMCYPGMLDGINNRHWSTLSFTAVILGIADSLLDDVKRNAEGILPQTETVEFHLILRAAEAFVAHCVASEPPVSTKEYRTLVRDCKTFVTRMLAKQGAALFIAQSGAAYRFSSSVSRKFRDLLAGPALRPPAAIAFDDIWEELRRN